MEKRTEFCSLSLDCDTVSNEIYVEKETDDKLPVGKNIEKRLNAARSSLNVR